MTTEQWQQIESLFEAALEQPAEGRAGYLAKACDDPQVRREVARMLAAGDKAGAFLEAPARVFAADLVATEEAAPSVEHVGPYRLVREIGRGGMGTVYLAERVDGQFEQRVALKLLRPGLGAGRSVERFLAERQILASLQHPNIARLYDGGETEEGVPYFVMEYVEGQPLPRYCDDKRLSVEERLRLFERVGEAVHYAHQNLVVHRDLKPSNILVTEEGVVKLLDFGIAKLLADEPGREDPLTRTGDRVMTPEYAAPEQIKGEPITTVADVYQLGVVLYELLTGHRPYRLEKRSVYEIERAVCEEEPMRPSTAVTQTEEVVRGETTDRITPEAVSRARRVPIEQLQKKLSGDLDAIVLKALRKEPAERFASAEALIEDVRRYRAARPVEARQGSVHYRARTFVRRHRWSVAAALAFLLLLVGYAATITAQQAHTARERDRAERYAAFIMDLFASPDPFAPVEAEASRDVTVRAFMNQSLRRVRSELATDPDMQAELLLTIARVKEHLGLSDEARALYAEVLSQYRQRHGDVSPEVVETMQRLAWVTEEPPAADSLYRRQRDLARQLEDGTGPLGARGLFRYGNHLFDQGRFEEAARMLDESVSVLRAAGPSQREHLAEALLFSAQVHRALNRLQTADSLLGETYEIRRELHGADHPFTATVMAERGVVAHHLGDLDRAAHWKRRALAAFEDALGETHPYTVTALNNLTTLLDEQGAYAEAVRLQRRVHVIREEQYGEAHEETVKALQNLASYLLRQGDLDAAEPLFRDAHRLFRRALPSDHYMIALPLLSLTDLYVQRGAYEQAESAARQAATHLEAALPEGHPLAAVARSRLGEALTGQRRYREAEPLLLRSFEQLQAAEGVDAYEQNACRRLVTFYDASGRPDEAARYRQLLSAR